MSQSGGGASRSTEPASGTSASTDVSLREFLMAEIKAAEAKADAHFMAMEKAIDAAFKAAETATTKVEDATSVRFQSFNEFNQRIDTILANTATRDAVAALGEKLSAEIARTREDLAALAKRIDLREGTVEGSRLTMGNIVTLITIAVAVIGVVVVGANYLAK
jgi:hypothetical protein